MTKKTLSILLIFCMVFTLTSGSFANSIEVSNNSNIKLIERESFDDGESFKYSINNEIVDYKVLKPKNGKQLVIMNNGEESKNIIKDLSTGEIYYDGKLAAKVSIKSTNPLMKEFDTKMSISSSTTWSETPIYGSWQDYTSNMSVKEGDIRWYESNWTMAQGVIIGIVLLASPWFGPFSSIAVGAVASRVISDRHEWTYFTTTTFEHDDLPRYYEHNSVFYYDSARTLKYSNDVHTVYSMTW